MFLSKELINWFVFTEMWTQPATSWRRPYDLWLHADHLVNNHPDKLFLIDAISALKKAVDFRVKNINEEYNLKAISFEFKKKNKFERLASLSVIKPIMLSKLIEIRNKLEHHDDDPPSKAVCEELIEFVWYFLRSTDQLSQSIVTAFNLCLEDNSESRYWLSLEPQWINSWQLFFRGWLPPNFISEIDKDDFFKIQIKEIETKEHFLKRIKSEEGFENIKNIHKDKRDDDIHVRGIVSDEETKLKLIYKYFQLNNAL